MINPGFCEAVPNKGWIGRIDAVGLAMATPRRIRVGGSLKHSMGSALRALEERIELIRKLRDGPAGNGRSAAGSP